jgi:hypothetical protein
MNKVETKEAIKVAEVNVKEIEGSKPYINQ